MKRLLVLLVLVLLGVAAAAWWFSPSRRESSEPAFSYAPAEYGSLTETVSATGALQPSQVFPVGTELAGKVVEVAADFNQAVGEGDLLLRLDDRVPREKLKQADTAVALAKADVERAKAQEEAAQKGVDRLRSLPADVAMRKDLDTSEAQLKAAKAAVTVAGEHVKEAEDARRLAQLALKMTRVYVPVLAHSTEAKDAGNGVGALAPEGTAPASKRKFIVMDRKVELNQQVGPPLSAQLFLLGGDLAQMQVVAQVAEGDIGRIRRGQDAEFTVSAYGDDTQFAGKVSDWRLLPKSDHGAIYYSVVIDAPNVTGATAGDWKLRPGMTASVDVVVRRHKGVWKVPLSAVNFQMPDEYQTGAAKAKLAEWQGRKDRDLWRPVWVSGAGHKPWPLFVRLGGTNAQGETGVADTQFGEVLEWDPELQPPPSPQEPATAPQLIIGAPPPNKGSIFNLPKVKL